MSNRKPGILPPSEGISTVTLWQFEIDVLPASLPATIT